MLITDDYVFVCNPRTASRSTIESLRDVLEPGSYDDPKQHHPKTNHPALVSGKEVIGVVRNPYDTIVSWWHHAGRPADVPFPEFVRHYKINWLYDANLVIYHAYITRYLNYELGVSEIVRRITGKPQEKDRRIGATGEEPCLWTPELMEQAKARFQKDFDIYEATF